MCLSIRVEHVSVLHLLAVYVHPVSTGEETAHGTHSSFDPAFKIMLFLDFTSLTDFKMVFSFESLAYGHSV